MKRRTRLFAITGLALVAFVAAAYRYERGHEATPGAATAYTLAVTRDGRTLRRFSVSELEGLGVGTVKMQGQDQTGPTVLAVLKAAGVESFSAVRVVGSGARDGGKLELSRTEIDDRVLLGLADRGTAKLCGPDIPHGSRVRDVTELSVR